MALETWLHKVKKTVTNSLTLNSSSTPPKMKHPSSKTNVIGVLAFEIADLMSKLLHLWNSLSDKNIIRLRNDSISLEGVGKIVSNDEAFLLDLACAELVQNLRLIAKSVSRLSLKCEDFNLRSFDRLLDEFSNTGRVRNNWLLSLKEMETNIKKMDNFIGLTATLHREMDELLVLENGYKKSLQLKEKEGFSFSWSSKPGDHKIIEQQQKILWQRQQVKYLKEKSLWSKTFDTSTSLLGRCIFTILSRIKLLFGINYHRYPISLPRSLSACSTVFPTINSDSCNFVSGPLIKRSSDFQEKRGFSFFETYSKILEPPSGTLGAAALALHYANLVIVLDKMIRSPQLIGEDARFDLYSMLPNSIRLSLRARLKGVGFYAGDRNLAGEWRAALHNILSWLSPLAQNMIKWQSERSFEQQQQQQQEQHMMMSNNTNVLLLQTLYFANQEKTEAAITELLVGLNCIWRFEKEMNSKTLLECGNFNRFLNFQNSV